MVVRTLYIPARTCRRTRRDALSALPVALDNIGAVLVDHLKSVDWQGRNRYLSLQSRPQLTEEVRAYIAALLHIR